MPTTKPRGKPSFNQLTSYRSTPYEPLRRELTGRQVPGHAYLATVKTGRNLSQRQARQLLAADSAQRDHAQRQQRLEDLHATIARRASQHPDTAAAAAPTAGEKKELTRLYNADKRHEKHHRERAVKIEAIHQQNFRQRRSKSLAGKGSLAHRPTHRTENGAHEPG